MIHVARNSQLGATGRTCAGCTLPMCFNMIRIRFMHGYNRLWEALSTWKRTVALRSKGVEITQSPKPTFRAGRTYWNDPDGHEVTLYWAGAKRLRESVRNIKHGRRRAPLLSDGGTRSVILDTLGAVLGLSSAKNVYRQEYQEAIKLQKLAQEYGCCLLIIHHTNKGDGKDAVQRASVRTG